MRYGISIATLGEYADPRKVVALAVAAEKAGWDAVCVWDHLAFAWGVPSGDPFVILTAVAAATEKLSLVTCVTPLARRRVQVVANQLATLDVYSQGRVIFGAGLGGVDVEFSAFGEEGNARVRAEKLDEGLDVLATLMSGDPVTHQGKHYAVNNVTLAPLPVQRPRVPIWIGGESRAALRRAARWDGGISAGDDENCQMVQSPQAIADKVQYMMQHRTSQEPFAVAMSGVSTRADRQLVGEYGAAGVNFWLESLHGFRGDADALMARVKEGPAV